MTINEYIDSLPNVSNLTPTERETLVLGLAINSMTDEVGVGLIAYMPDVAAKIGKILKKAR